MSYYEWEYKWWEFLLCLFLGVFGLVIVDFLRSKK